MARFDFLSTEAGRAVGRAAMDWLLVELERRHRERFDGAVGVRVYVVRGEPRRFQAVVESRQFTAADLKPPGGNAQD